MRMTERDKKCYRFLCEYKIPMTTDNISKLFYLEGNTSQSALVIANRRLLKMVDEGYVNRLPRKFGEKAVFYCGEKPNPKTLRHKLVMSHFISELVGNQFKIKSLQFEYNLPEKYSIRMDMFITIEYNNQYYYLFTEVDTTKELNSKYIDLINDLNNGTFRTKYPVILVSITDFPIKDQTLKSNFIQLDTELSNFNKFLWRFVK